MIEQLVEDDLISRLVNPNRKKSTQEGHLRLVAERRMRMAWAIETQAVSHRHRRGTLALNWPNARNDKFKRI